MSRYIDADKLMSNAVIPLVKSASLRNRNLYSAVKRVANEIELAPTEDVAPVVHAHWIKHDYAEEFYDRIIPNYECSHCHGWFRDERDYCGECGAKMDEEEQDAT